MTAIEISGRAPDARFTFINGVYEPMQIQHNDKACFVSRGVAARYLFHSGQNRWCISKVLDDGYRCWAFITSGENTTTPADCMQDPTGWQACEKDGSWRADKGMQCKAVPASDDMFVKLRLSLDADMRQYGLIVPADLKKMWRRLDYNGNGVVSLAEIDKMVVELVSGGSWPAWLNNKPALMRAYKKTILKDGDGDSWVEKHEFHDLLLNIFWFNKLWQIFAAVDGDDRRMDVGEFQAGMSKMGLNLSPQDAQAEFAKMDTNHGGQVLFVEMCAYVRKRVNPDSHPEFDADITSGEDCSKASYNTAHHHGHGHGHGHHGHHAGHHAAHHAAHPHVQSREIDFAALGSSGGGGGGGGGGYQTMGSTAPKKTYSVESPHDVLRKAGGTAESEHKGTADLVYKKKCFGDFDTLEDKIKGLCHDHAGLHKAWRHLDYNGNGVVSLAEIDKWVVENYPLMNHKPALMRCYKCTIAMSDHHDGFCHSKDFKRLIVNLFYYNKLYWIFDQVDGDDRRITLPEFKQCLSLCKCNVSDAEANRDFQACDVNGGGMILFDEFCHYFASRACPQGMTDLTSDGKDRSHHDGTQKVLHAAQSLDHHAKFHGHHRF